MEMEKIMMMVILEMVNCSDGIILTKRINLPVTILNHKLERYINLD